MKVLFVPDVLNWAIGHLVQSKVKHLNQFECKVIAVHPRDAKVQAESFMDTVRDFEPDIIIYEYFRSAEQLINAQPDLKTYKSVLVHHNQRDKALFHADWNELGIDTIITHTSKAREKLNEKGYFNVETINHGIDLDFFTYSGEEPQEKQVGYVGRIVPWKGLKEVASACEELGYPLQIMGAVDKPEYWEQVSKKNLRFDYFECTDEERVGAYHNMSIYVGNSEDNYEEGTLPFLEALACGVPVVTTPNGVAKDIIQDEHNALLVPFGDYDALKNAIKRLMEDDELRKKLRKNGWNTVKNMTEKKMAWEYGKLIHQIVHKEDLVSVVIPSTFDRVGQVNKILRALENQTYNKKAIEAIVVWDEVVDLESIVLPKLAPVNITVRTLVTNKDGYNLAMARNLGAIESNGEFLMFCDSRLEPDMDSILVFVQAMDNLGGGRFWMFGDKGAQKISFVENFSFLKRADFFRFGMMNERINRYGGMSQEIRTRWIRQGGELSYVEQAKAKQLIKSGTDDKKRKDIIESKFQLLKMYNGEAN